MARTARRTWPQRLTIALLILTSIGALGTAGGLAAGQWVLSDRRLIVLDEPGEDGGTAGRPDVVVPGATAPAPTSPSGSVAAPPSTLALAEPDAANFLLVGADGGDCLADDPTVGPRDGNLRSDTVMVWRVNPSTNQVAVLSFPRDLYVELPSLGRNGRINEAYRDGAQALIDTIAVNFFIPIDHFIEVDFCAFVALVDAVGGVEVPFATAARDASVSFEVPAGCQNLDGINALRYVRSRHYQSQQADGTWRTDGTSDFGRIARQQDFIRRVLAKVISDELYRPDTISALVETNRKYLVTDDNLTPRKILEFANAIQAISPAEIATYRIASRSRNVGGASMQEPQINGDNMQAILKVFRGQATLASAPDQTFGTTVPATEPPATTVPGTTPSTSDPGSAPLPTVVVSVPSEGVSPDPNATC